MKELDRELAVIIQRLNILRDEIEAVQERLRDYGELKQPRDPQQIAGRDNI